MESLIHSPEVAAAVMKETGPAAGSCEQVVAKDSNIIGTRVTTAKVESANTMIRNIKKILAGSATQTTINRICCRRGSARTVA